VNPKLIFSLVILFAGAPCMAQEQESDFSQPAQSETVVEEYGPAHSALQEPKNDIDAEVKDSASDANDDFAHSVPEPKVAKSHLAGMKQASAKKSKHVAHAKKHAKVQVAKTKKHLHKLVAKNKKPAKVTRSIASVSKNKKHGKTLAKRGNSQSTLR
jgi:hypothetical protein